jgi:hypothetical protein
MESFHYSQCKWLEMRFNSSPSSRCQSQLRASAGLLDGTVQSPLAQGGGEASQDFVPLKPRERLEQKCVLMAL